MRKTPLAFHRSGFHLKRVLPLIVLGCSIPVSSLAAAGGAVDTVPPVETVVETPPMTAQEGTVLLTADLFFPDRSRLRPPDAGALVAAGFWPGGSVPAPTVPTVPLPGTLPPFGERDDGCGDLPVPFPEDVDTSSELEP